MEAAEYELMFTIESRYWWFVGKRWLVMRMLSRHLPAGSLKGLDVGCGTGRTLMALARFGEITGCDIAEPALAFCRSRGLANVVLQPRPDRLPFEESRFDFLTALDVVEHVENDAGMLSDMLRVLHPGGLALITAPAHPSLWSVHDDSLHHKRRYTREDLSEKVRAAGFEVLRITHMNALLLPLIVPVRKLRDLLKRGQPPTSDFNLNLPGPLNALFKAAFCAEWGILRFAPLPFGLSLLCIARRP